MYVDTSSNLTTLLMCHLFASAWSQTRGRTDERSLTASEKKKTWTTDPLMAIWGTVSSPLPCPSVLLSAVKPLMNQNEELQRNVYCDRLKQKAH